MGIKSRKDEIILNKATGKFEKTSIITSEMTAEELRNYHVNLTEHVKMLERELIACRAEIDNIVHLLGGGWIKMKIQRSPTLEQRGGAHAQ